VSDAGKVFGTEVEMVQTSKM